MPLARTRLYSENGAVLFDAHNHLQDERLAPDLKAVIERARLAGVTQMMVCATGAAGDWDRLRAIADCNPGTVSISLGLHPWQVATANAGWKTLLELALNTQPCGIGEVGLDAQHAPSATMEDQMKALAWQMDLACERDLPVTVHCIGAWDKLYELLLTRPALRFMMHAYKGSPELTRELTRMGAYFSIGPLTLVQRFKPAGPCVAGIPADRMLIETDAPDGPAHLNRGRAKPLPCEPAALKEVCEGVATLLGKTPEEIERQTSDNAAHFFAKALSK